MFKDFIKLLTPPIFVEGYRTINRKKFGLYLHGDYSSWSEAVADSSGYDASHILEKTRDALLKVKNNEAVHEMDSILFDEIQYAWPVLAGLMWVAAQSDGHLNVLDFGGSLGSAYFQKRHFLPHLKKVRWNIVEQPQHVETGRQWFEDDNLKFHFDIEECLAETQPNVVLLSSVLHYLEHPYRLLEQVLSLPCDYVLIDRTPFWEGAVDRLCVQNVPPVIYPASYPCWIFSRQRFQLHIPEEWKLVAEFDSLDNFPSPVKTTWRGMILSRKSF
ncbi:MAG: methyltransferase, TIGR04325 family [Chloroflexi bacterium]|nr:methyltransferase, TIGR04325 family [Chloroflexota bacterium]